MRSIARYAFAALALALFLQPKPAHAEALADPCIPILTCPANPPQDAPEISGSMLSTGLAVVSGIAVMVRSRRKAIK